MKKKFDIYFKIFVSSIAFAAVLILAFSITVGVKSKTVNDSVENVPYKTSEAPLFWGLLIDFSGGKSVYFGFDAEKGSTSVLILPESSSEAAVEEYGYAVNTVSKADFDFLWSLIDSFGGVELNSDGETFNYTGVQVAEMLKKSNDTEFKKRVANKLLLKIKEQGMEKKDILLLIEETETILTFPEGYYLNETVNNSLNNIKFVN